MTNPAALKYLKSIASHIAGDWGFTYLKMDGFSTGAVTNPRWINLGYQEDDFGDAVLFNPNKTNIEALRDGGKMIRQTVGPDVFLLGCCCPQNMRSFGGAFGLVDAMRVGPDNAGNWADWKAASPMIGAREYFLNGRIWYNDPDPSYVRSSVTLDEARTMASWVAISGQLYSNGDWIPGLPPERLDILKRTLAPHGKMVRPVDFMDRDVSRIWQVTDGTGGARRDIVALFNFDDNPQQIKVPLAKLDLPQALSYAGFEFWSNTFLPPIKDEISRDLPPHSCQIIALRAAQDHPFIVSTSRHVTQGMIDLTDEKWNPTSNTLSGKSRIVAGDPYELRIATPAGETWQITQAIVNETGATIVSSDKSGLRATINTDVDGSVGWKLVFKHGQ
jgi:hypothetical protein